MIEKLFSDSLDHLRYDSLCLIQNSSSNTRKNSNFQDFEKTLSIRKDKHQLLFSNQTLKLIQKLTNSNYIKEFDNMKKIEFLQIKNSNDLFFGQTSILQSDNQFFKGQTKVPQGLCEILYKDGHYFIGNFQKGVVQSDFIFILANGYYIKSRKAEIKAKKALLGFIIQNQDEKYEQLTNNSTDSDEIEQSDIKFQILEKNLPINFKFLECQINYKGIQYQGPLKQGLFHGKIYQKGPDYSFQGNYYQGQRKIGKYKIKSQLQYQGTFKDNKFHGLGTLKTQKGVYSGEFINGLKDGQGQFKSPDGSSYYGEFLDDKICGRGRFKSAQGIFQDRWIDQQIEENAYQLKKRK